MIQGEYFFLLPFYEHDEFLCREQMSLRHRLMEIGNTVDNVQYGWEFDIFDNVFKGTVAFKNFAS